MVQCTVILCFVSYSVADLSDSCVISVFQTSGVVSTRPEGMLVGKDFLCSLRDTSACVHSCIGVCIFGF